MLFVYYGARRREPKMRRRLEVYSTTITYEETAYLVIGSPNSV